MEIKKDPKLEMDYNKWSRYLIGVILPLSLLFICLEWSNYEKEVARPVKNVITWEDEELIPITTQDDVKPLTPPPPAPAVVEELLVVENDASIEETEIETSEQLDQVIAIKHIDIIEEEEDIEEEVFTIVETMPQFPGGEEALRKFLAENIKYPLLAQENGIQGKVIVEFVVGKDGGVYDIAINKAVEGSLDKEALRVVGTMPKWIPGKKNGKAVKVKYFLPILFRFQ